MFDNYYVNYDDIDVYFVLFMHVLVGNNGNLDHDNFRYIR